MAAPDILDVNVLEAKTSIVQNVSSLGNTILFNVVDSNVVYKINDVTVSNTDGVTQTDITVNFTRGATKRSIARFIAVPAESSLTVISKDSSIYLEEGDGLIAIAGTDNILQISISYEIISASVAGIVSNALAIHLDANDTASYSGSGSTWADIGYSQTNFTLNNATYYSFVTNPKAISFNRTMPPTAEAGAYAEATGAGEMTAFNYLHNNHSTEVWFKVDDRDPTLYTANELFSTIVNYPGFHSGWFYNGSVYQYVIWGQTIGSVNNSTSLNFSDTSEGVWTQLVAVRNDFDLYLYKNGVYQTTARIDAGFLGTPSGNTLRIAMAALSASDFSYHADINVAILRMYKKALTAEEVLQNYNAQKSRFGLS